MRLAVLLAILGPLQSPPPACSIEGRVSNLLSGGPVRRARIVLAQGKYETVTDSNGRYAIRDIAPGRYSLSVERPGFLPTAYGAHGPNRPGKSLVLAAGEARKDVDFLLEPPAVITGHVYDQDGEILSVPVQLFREVWRNGMRRLDAAGGANADDEGEYRLYGLPPGNYVVASAQTPVRPASPVPTHEVYPTTFYPGTEDATAASVLRLAAGGEARNIDLHVRKTVSISVSGTIVTAAGLDPAMRLTLARRDGVPGQQAQMMYPQPGEFSARGVTPGSYILTARTDKEYARQQIDVGTVDVAGIEVRLAPLLTLAGTVTLDGAAPPEIIWMSAERGEPPAIARPDAKGALMWKGLTPGKWTQDFNPKPAGFYLKSPAGIEIGPDGHEPVQVVLSSQGAQVSGKVPVEGSTVLLIPDGEKPVRVLKFAVANADGNYVIDSIPPGKYRLVALEDIESQSWENPVVAQRFEGGGMAVDLGTGAKVSIDLTLFRP
jgi:hypothetical protein